MRHFSNISTHYQLKSWSWHMTLLFPLKTGVRLRASDGTADVSIGIAPKTLRSLPTDIKPPSGAASAASAASPSVAATIQASGGSRAYSRRSSGQSLGSEASAKSRFSFASLSSFKNAFLFSFLKVGIIWRRSRGKGSQLGRKCAIHWRIWVWRQSHKCLAFSGWQCHKSVFWIQKF